MDTFSLYCRLPNYYHSVPEDNMSDLTPPIEKVEERVRLCEITPLYGLQIPARRRFSGPPKNAQQQPLKNRMN
jgi:hypothetical protein